MPLAFGTSGLRGLATEMTDAACAAHVAAFLRHLSTHGRLREVLVGRDLRPSSPRIARAVTAAIAGGGLVAIDCGPLPTPALALEAAWRGAPAVMVTGSHIPFDRNGLKFYRAEGEITKADEAGILAHLGNAPTTEATPESDGGAAARAYVARYVTHFGSERLTGLRIGLFEHSAAGRDLTAAILLRLGAEVVRLGRTDDFVPIDTEAIAVADAARFAGWVARHRLDALVATDGDGDRPLLVDETGCLLRGDAIGILTARVLGADAVAAPLNVSTALEESVPGARVRRTRIGSPHVIAAVEDFRREGAKRPVGFEANGGFLLGEPIPGPRGSSLAALATRDAMLPLLTVLVASLPLGGVARLAASLPPRGTASDRLAEVAPAASAALLAAFQADPASLLAGLDLGPAAEISDLDGVRVFCIGGDIVHLRASGNAPELRVYAEGATAERAAGLVAAVLARASAWLAR